VVAIGFSIAGKVVTSCQL